MAGTRSGKVFDGLQMCENKLTLQLFMEKEEETTEDPTKLLQSASMKEEGMHDKGLSALSSLRFKEFVYTGKFHMTPASASWGPLKDALGNLEGLTVFLRLLKEKVCSVPQG